MSFFAGICESLRRVAAVYNLGTLVPRRFPDDRRNWQLEALMDTLVLDPYVSDRLLRERRERGIDVYDEVWEGVYVMAPAPNDEHQGVGLRLARRLLEVVEDTGLGVVRPSINLAVDPENWERDYRIPDIAVFLKESSAVCHNTFWSGPPDFLVEIISPYDKSRAKLDFYSKIGAKEVLLIDREPWQLELYRRHGNKLVLSAVTKPDDATRIESDVLPLQFRLLQRKGRPAIEVTCVNSKMSWTI
jgi:Uma2 family endonuclease